MDAERCKRREKGRDGREEKGWKGRKGRDESRPLLPVRPFVILADASNLPSLPIGPFEKWTRAAGGANGRLDDGHSTPFPEGPREFLPEHRSARGRFITFLAENEEWPEGEKEGGRREGGGEHRIGEHLEKPKKLKKFSESVDQKEWSGLVSIIMGPDNCLQKLGTDQSSPPLLPSSFG